MPTITDIPVEVLIDNLLPQIPIRDLLSLAATNRAFTQLAADETFWKRKLQADFNFNGNDTARTSGWKAIYKGLSRPKVFTWGENSHGRLGHGQRGQDVPYPKELHIPGARIVSLVAGGMSFHALDSEGNVWVWGTLNGTDFTLSSDGYSEPGKAAPKPLRLQLSTPTRSISCGRLHSTTLDAAGHIWTFLSWGRPFRLRSPLVDCTTPSSTPAQVECGWAFSAALTHSGEVLVWFPFGGVLAPYVTARNTDMDHEGDKKAQATAEGVVECYQWEVEHDPRALPGLPALPELHGDSSETVLVKIAAMDKCLIGLTNQGHVLKYGELVSETTVGQGRWEYLPEFSEAARVGAQPAFADADLTGLRIMHISANFNTFTAYSTAPVSVVLTGTPATTPDTAPQIVPALQNRAVIAVVLGDYHLGALTAAGTLLTWGAYSRGALGLGDPVDLAIGAPGGFADDVQLAQARQGRRRATPDRVEVPCEVRFDWGEKKRHDTFCFAAAAGGWHTGALVIDLEVRV
ncbi:hypothetical protein PLICRDRAFT_115016 [Plicaturopsis crispa FD-325 SS-3]|nr:hypothetical protein PLICRDRAFT_115016 [Plicaturopsis crispa FD-325 SS-3]